MDVSFAGCSSASLAMYRVGYRARRLRSSFVFKEAVVGVRHIGQRAESGAGFTLGSSSRPTIVIANV